MKFFIPPLGTVLKLKQHWHFSLLCEGRNKTLWDQVASVPFNKIPYRSQKSQFCDVVIPEDSLLTVDRIFCRRGSEKYNSVTFRASVKFDGVTRRVRFFVALGDVNGIEMEVIR